MIKRVEKQNNGKPSTAKVVSGRVESVNEKGLKVNSHWYNYSKFLSQKPEIRENDEVEFMTSGDFITKFLNVQHQTTESENDDADGLLLNSLRSAVKIASIIESEVSIKFSTQDIIKLALTLFIQKSSI
jgi:hypothetical protein